MPRVFHYERNFIENPQKWWWPLLQEMFEHKPRELKFGGSRVSTIMLRKKDLPADVQNAAQRISGGPSRPLKTFSSHVGMLAGKVADFTGITPDLCTLNLYRDGDDYLRPHHDPEWLYGPTLDNVVIATLSFGATRLLRHRLIGAMSTVAGEWAVEAGSLAIMQRDFQRELFHEIVQDDTQEPRLSLTFTCAQQELPEDTCWYLMTFTPEAQEDLERANPSEDRDRDLPVRHVRLVGELGDLVEAWGDHELESDVPLAAIHPATGLQIETLEVLLQKYPEMKEFVPEEHRLVQPPDERYLPDDQLPPLDKFPWDQLPPQYLTSLKQRAFDEMWRRERLEKSDAEDTN